MAKPTAHHVEKAYPFLGDGGTVTPLEVTESFWSEIGSGAFDHLGSGVLVSCFSFDADWDAWERHPAGDEVVCLLEGDVEFVLDLPEGEASIRLSEPGGFAVVPRGVWHTARVRAPSRVLFLTRGDGTEHRPA